MFIVIYRPHGALMLDTQHIGPFGSEAEAYDYLCDCVPALGPNTTGQQSGVKYTQEMVAPLWAGVHA